LHKNYHYHKENKPVANWNQQKCQRSEAPFDGQYKVVISCNPSLFIEAEGELTHRQILHKYAFD
jgi:hypothetical protein